MATPTASISREMRPQPFQNRNARILCMVVVRLVAVAT
jgi:hypothetical protein